VQNDIWKVADFGLTAQGTSKREHETQYSRGTPSYRAPELILNGKFTNKVDIWALGCIFFEMAFEKRAFSGDLEVHQYTQNYAKGDEGISFPPYGSVNLSEQEDWKAFICATIQDMLEVEPRRRPSAKSLQGRFSGFLEFAQCPLRPFFSGQELTMILGPGRTYEEGTSR
jgi:serine/threonine protein kinase